LKRQNVKPDPPWITFHVLVFSSHLDSRVNGNPHMAGLIAAKRKVIAAESKFNRITQRRPANDFDRRAVAKTHLQQSPPNIRLTTDGNNLTMTSDAELVQAASRNRAGTARRKFASIWHVEESIVVETQYQ
jgi:hypothetical protein